MNDTRIEKKFIFGKHQSDFVKKLLVVNNFQKLYPDRSISSIYIDTLDFNYAKDNINGVNERKKLRIRWYNSDLDNVYFEKKNKRNFFVWKDIEKVKSSFSKTNLIYKLQELLSKPNNIIVSITKCTRPQAPGSTDLLRVSRMMLGRWV